MPEEIISEEEFMNICFNNLEILNHKKCIILAKSKENSIQDYINVFYRKGYDISVFNFAERFNMTLNMFDIYDPDLTTKDFIQGYRYCYQGPKSSYYNFIANDLLSNVNKVEISIGAALPIFDQSRLQKIDRIFPIENKSVILGASSYTYNITRMQSPYADHCIPYQDRGYADRNDATSRCENERLMQQYGVVSDSAIIAKSDIDSYRNLTLRFHPVKGESSCKNLWKYFACNEIIFQTQISLNENNKLGHHLYFVFVDNKEASTRIVSKPRIDKIDYITYILGALGSWIEFSFIGINPIPWILKYHDGPSMESAAQSEVAQSVRNRVQDVEITRLKNISTNHERNFTIAKNERQKLELICHRMQKHINKMKEETDQKLTALKNAVSKR